MSTLQATISERGNGFPDVGDHVPGDDGNLYLVVSTTGRVETGRRPGESNWIRAEVALADWSDCDDGEEGPGQVIVGDEKA